MKALNKKILHKEIMGITSSIKVIIRIIIRVSFEKIKYIFIFLNFLFN